MKVVSQTPQIVSYRDAVSLGYPANGSQTELFVLYEITTDQDFQKWYWNDETLQAIRIMTDLKLDNLLFLGDFQ
jgi:hypothetical protein